MELKKDLLKRHKLLGEDCWVDLTDEIRIKIDYLTRAQETEYRILRMRWDAKQAEPNEQHWIEYYLRAAIRDVQGFTTEGNKMNLEHKSGLACDLVFGETRLDVIAVFAEFTLLEAVFGLVHERLEFNDEDKKKLQSQESSSKKESSEAKKNSNPAQKSSMAGDPLDEMERLTASNAQA